MKGATVIAVALASFSSFPSPAQPQLDKQHLQAPAQPDQSQQPSSTPQQQPSQAPGDSTNSVQPQTSPQAAQLAPVKAELVSKLDSNSAKQGDTVVVKTDESIKTASGTEIPKGSKLTGHVTNVQARGDTVQNSQIAIQFDRAELKGGQSVPIESVIQSVAPATDVDASNAVPMAGAPGAPAGNGSMAGTANNNMPGQSNMPNQSSTPNQNTNQNPGLAGNTSGQVGATNQNTNIGAPAPGSIVARRGNIAIRTTSIPGVLLANNINGLPFSNASGLLVGARRDIHLDGGTKMIVAVAEAPQGAGSGMTR